MVAALILLCACGRIGFESRGAGDAGGARDAGARDAGTSDAQVQDAEAPIDGGPTDGGTFMWPDASVSAGEPVYVGHHGGGGADQGYDVGAGPDGRVVAVGTFQGSFSFDAESVISRGGTDGFVAAFEPSGATRWALPIGGLGSDRAQGVEIDGAGTSFVCGLFALNVDFGGMMRAAVGMADAFVAAYDGSGTLRWVERIGTAGDDFAYDVTIDPSGEVVVTGYYQGTLTIGTEMLPEFGDRDIFVAKFSSGGTFRWARGFGSPGLDSGQGVAVNAAGNVFVTGGLGGPTTFGTMPIGNAGESFVLELTPAGEHVWSIPLPNVTAWEIAVSRADGRILVGARVSTGADFGMGPITTRGGSDGLVLSYAADHRLEWYRDFGGALDDLGLGITTDASGRVYMIGMGGADIDFGMGLVTGHGEQDVFVAAYDPAGALRFGRLFGGAVQDRGYGIAVAPSGALWITGRYAGDSMFGTTPIPSAGMDDIFLTRLE